MHVTPPRPRPPRAASAYPPLPRSRPQQQDVGWVLPPPFLPPLMAPGGGFDGRVMRAFVAGESVGGLFDLGEGLRGYTMGLCLVSVLGYSCVCLCFAFFPRRVGGILLVGWDDTMCYCCARFLAFVFFFSFHMLRDDGMQVGLTLDKSA